MKPIHKLNNGRGATLCHICSVIITTGLTKDLYCEKCKPKQETLEQIDQNNPITRGSTALVYKQETFEEAAKSNYDNKTARIPVPTSHWINSEFLQIQNFKEGAKFQQERMFEIMDAFTEDVMGGCNLRAKEWFEQFKKK